MIDFHSHILPNIDDGARSIEETEKLIEEAEEVGFETIISTSHYIENYYEADVEKRKGIIEQLNENLEQEERKIRIHLGNEVYFTENIKKLLKDNQITTIEGTKYLLFEMPLNAKPLNLYDVVYDMLQLKLKPILAHPERYSFIQENPNIIKELIETGVLMQANYGSIVGQYGQKAQIIVKKLLENDMIHFLGSDVHRSETIYPQIPKMLNEIEKIVGEEKLEKLTTINAESVLEDEEIEIEDPIEIKLGFREKMKLKTKK